MTYRIDDSVRRLLAEHGVPADDFNDEIERRQPLVPSLESERMLTLAAAFCLRWRRAGFAEMTIIEAMRRGRP